MKRFLTADDVVSDIQFELLQSEVSRDELMRSIQAFKSHHNRLRDQCLATWSPTKARAVVARLFQLNDGLLALLEAMASQQQEMRSELRQLGQYAYGGLPEKEVQRGRRLLLDMWSTSELDTLLDQWPPRELRDAMKVDSLLPIIVIQPVRIPFFGGLINRFRRALHQVAVFYVERLARRQAEINAMYGGWIEQVVANAHEQQEMLRVLSQKVSTGDDEQSRDVTA